jgi:hypothetical protein
VNFGENSIAPRILSSFGTRRAMSSKFCP